MADGGWRMGREPEPSPRDKQGVGQARRCSTSLAKTVK